MLKVEKMIILAFRIRKLFQHQVESKVIDVTCNLKP